MMSIKRNIKIKTQQFLADKQDIKEEWSYLLSDFSFSGNSANVSDKKIDVLMSSLERTGYKITKNELKKFSEFWRKTGDKAPAPIDISRWLESRRKWQSETNSDSKCSAGFCDGSGYLELVDDQNRSICTPCYCKTKESPPVTKKELLNDYFASIKANYRLRDDRKNTDMDLLKDAKISEKIDPKTKMPYGYPFVLGQFAIDCRIEFNLNPIKIINFLKNKPRLPMTYKRSEVRLYAVKILGDKMDEFVMEEKSSPMIGRGLSRELI